MATNRIKKELRDWNKSPIDGVKIIPSESDMFEWRVLLAGPKDTPYEGGEFETKVSFPPDYPWKPPKIKILTQCFHINVNENGYICMDILSGSWTPALTIGKVILSFISMLMDPNPDHALVPERAKMYKSNPDEYFKTVREWTEKYAMNK